MSTSNVSSSNFSLAQFEMIAGGQNSTGYVKVAGDKLQKAAAHRFLTFKNGSEMKSVNSQGGAYVRYKLFEAIQDSLKTPENAVETDKAKMNRFNILKNAAARLGIPVTVDEKNLSVTQNRGEAIESAPLERRDVRLLIKILKTPDYQLLLEGPSEADKRDDADTLRSRDTLISAMKKAFSGIKWSEVPLGSLDLSSLRQLSNALMDSKIKTMDDLKAFCAMHRKTDQINDEAALLQLKHMQELLSTQEGKDEVTRLVSVPSDNPKVAENKAPLTDPVLEKNLPEGKDEVSGNKGLQNKVELGNPKQSDAAIEAAKIEETLADTVWGIGDALKEAFSTKGGKIDKLVDYLIEDVTESASKGEPMKDVLLRHRAALTFLITESPENVNAVLERVPFGALLKESVNKMREETSQYQGYTKLVFFGLASKLTPDLTGKIEAALNANRSQQIHSLVENTPEDAMKNLREQLDKVLQSRDPNATPESRVRTLISTLRKNTDSLTALLCEPEKMLAHFGNEKLLGPVLRALKEKANTKINEALKTDPDKKVDFVQMKFSGRIAEELDAILDELLESDSVLGELAPSGLNSEDQTAMVLLDLLQNLIADAFSTTSLTEQVEQTSKNLTQVGTKDVHNFLADLVLEQETWITDNATPGSGERMQSILGRHLDTLAVLLCNPESYAKQMGLPQDVLAMIDSIKTMVEPLGLLFGPGNEGFARIALGKSFDRMQAKDFALLESLVDKATQKAMDTIQDIASVAFEGMVKGEDIGDFSDISEHLTHVKNFTESIKSQDDPGKIPQHYINRFVKAFDAIGKDAGGLDLSSADKEAFQKVLSELRLSESEQQDLIEDFSVEDVYARQLEQKSELDKSEHDEHQQMADIVRVVNFLRDTKSTDPQVLALKDKFNAIDPNEPGPKTAIETRLANLEAVLKEKDEVRFFQKLDNMTLKEGFDKWAKHMRYDAKTRGLMMNKLVTDLQRDSNEPGDPTTKTLFKDFRAGFDSINAKMEDFFLAPGFPLTQFEPLENLNPEQLELHRIRESSLADLSGSGVLDTKTGYGKFMVEVMKHYFHEVSPQDQRSMLSALLRYGTLKAVDENSTQEQRDAVNKANLANLMGSLFKGAGPIMQKLLQQLGSMPLPAEFKAALKDMKCNLLPIPEEMVKSQLLGIVEEHNREVDEAIAKGLPTGPKIANIRMNKVMGAASVGEAVLCTVKYEDNSPEREVIVKLLRPEADNRMRREEALFLEIAKTVEGMEQTYLGRLDRIKEELDFRIEAGNVESGQIYDSPLMVDGKSFADVKSMKLASGFKATKSTMVIERAPGTTVSNYLEETAQMRKALVDSINDENTIEHTRSKLAAKLEERIEDLKAKQEQLTHLASKWVSEGLFKKGFYHGDLHAGNIMIDDKKVDGVDKGLTVIDFGNATKLSKDEQNHIMRMIYATTYGESKLFMENYKALMTPQSRLKLTPETFNTAVSRLNVIFSKGNSSDAGQRIGAALSELQKLGLELPAPIFNFSQCQILMQGTIAEINQELSECEIARNKFYAPRFNGEQYLDLSNKEKSNLPLQIVSRNEKVLSQLESMFQDVSNWDPKDDYEIDFINCYTYVKNELDKNEQESVIEKYAQIAREENYLSNRSLELNEALKELEQDSYALSLSDPELKYFEPIKLSDEMQEVLGLNKKGSSLSVQNVKAKIDEKLAVLKDADVRSKLEELKNQIKDYPPNWSMRSNESFFISAQKKKFIDAFPKCGTPMTKKKVNELLTSEIAKLKSESENFKRYIDSYNSFAKSIKDKCTELKNDFINEKKSDDPNCDKKALEKVKKFLALTDLNQLDRNDPDMLRLEALFKEKFESLSEDGGKSIPIPEKSQLHENSNDGAGHMKLTPSNINFYTTAVLSPERTEQCPNELLSWMQSRQKEISLYADDEIVYGPPPLSESLKKIMEDHQLIGKTMKQLRDKLESAVETTRSDIKTNSDALNEIRTKNNPYLDLLMNLNMLANRVPAITQNREYYPLSQDQEKYSFSDVKDFFQVTGETMLKNKWKTAKAVGAQAVLKVLFTKTS